MKSPVAILATTTLMHSMKREATDSIGKSSRAYVRISHLPLWTVGITLAAFAIWLLFSSVSTQSLLGVLVGASWLITIFFDSFILKHLLR